ncbi:hypothetical protein [Micromonospora sp. NPDC049679]|uniref:hypothetical protein n=1 Tax=Micromonospora sp. NPDC049679 TaxID=3155920 RepID=UPI0033D9F461
MRRGVGFAELMRGLGDAFVRDGDGEGESVTPAATVVEAVGATDGLVGVPVGSAEFHVGPAPETKDREQSRTTPAIPPAAASQPYFLPHRPNPLRRAGASSADVAGAVDAVVSGAAMRGNSVVAAPAAAPGTAAGTAGAAAAAVVAATVGTVAFGTVAFRTPAFGTPARAVGATGAVALTGGAGSASAFLTFRLSFPRGFAVFAAAGVSVAVISAASTGGVVGADVAGGVAGGPFAGGVAGAASTGGAAALFEAAARDRVGGVDGVAPVVAVGRVAAAASAAIMWGSSMVADGSAERATRARSAGCGVVSDSSSGRWCRPRRVGRRSPSPV